MHSQYRHAGSVVVVPAYFSTDGARLIVRDSRTSPVYFDENLSKAAQATGFSQVTFDPTVTGRIPVYDLVLRPQTGQVKLAKSLTFDETADTYSEGFSASIIEIAKASDEKRYTFGVVYKASPDAEHPIEDAHRDFVTADDLESAQWDYVRKTGADRSIFIQHKRPPFGFQHGGEWVSIATLPFPVTTDFKHADGRVEKRTIPSGSVWMGVVWDQEIWPMVKSGEITGYSFGGKAQRYFDDE